MIFAVFITSDVTAMNKKCSLRETTCSSNGESTIVKTHGESAVI